MIIEQTQIIFNYYNMTNHKKILYRNVRVYNCFNGLNYVAFCSYPIFNLHYITQKINNWWDKAVMFIIRNIGMKAKEIIFNVVWSLDIKLQIIDHFQIISQVI